MADAQIRWTNPSVKAFVADQDPVMAVMSRARAVVMEALDKGWTGPPFDPLALADILEINVIPTEEVRDARLVADEHGRPRIEYNPVRPRGRLRYSLAHEIAHTLFQDWPDQVRHRGVGAAHRRDDWQLEALCNIAAAELLMPLGDCGRIAESDAGIDVLLEEQGRFEVSMEALLIRAIRVRPDACAMFCASRLEEGVNKSRYRIDYLISSRLWPGGLRAGTLLPERSVVTGCTAIGFTGKGDERWGGQAFPVHIECSGIPPYPGRVFPKVVGLLLPMDRLPAAREGIEYLKGDATQPRGEGVRLIVHVVNDTAEIWGGRGFAAALRRACPVAQEDFKEWVQHERGQRRRITLGQVRLTRVADNLFVASMIAQSGYGESIKPRIRYSALLSCLQQVATFAKERHASAHMPRIGCGLAGGSWDVVEELLRATLVAHDVPVTVYDPPGTELPAPRQLTLKLSASKHQ